MARSAGKLIFEIAANTATLRRDLNSAQTQINTFSKKITNVFSAIGKVAAFGGISYGALRAVTAVSSLVKSVANLGDEMRDASKRFGVSIELLSSLKHAAEQNGSSFEELGIGLRSLSRAMYEALQSRSGAAAKAFKELDVEITDARGNMRPLRDVLFDIADRFSKMEDGANKVALAQKVLGKSGSNLIPTLNEGSAALEENIGKAEKYHAVVTKAAGEASDRFNDSINDLSLAFQGLKQNIITPSVLNSMANGFNNVAENVSKLTLALRMARGELYTPEQLKAIQEYQTGKMNNQNAPSYGAQTDELADAINKNRQLQNIRENLLTMSDEDFKTAADILGVSTETLETIKRANEEYNKTPAALQKIYEAEIKVLQGSRALGVVPDSVINGRIEQLQKAMKELFPTPHIDIPKPGKSGLQPTVIDFGVGYVEVMKQAWETYFGTREQITKRLEEQIRDTREAMAIEGGLPAEVAQAQIKELKTQIDALYRSPFPDVKKIGAEKGFSYLQQFADDAKDTAGMVEQAFVNAFMNVENAIRDMVMTGTANLQDLIRAIGADLVQIFVRSAITGPAASFLGGFFKASGGPVYAGNAYMVGERGPELFVPGTSGRIEPNGRGGGVTVQMNIVTQDAASFRESEPQMLSRLGSAISRAMRSNG